MNTLSERLRHAIELAKQTDPDMSQSELARRINVRPQAIQYLCSDKGGKDKRSRYINDIARILNVNSEWLATGKGEPRGQVVHAIEPRANEGVQESRAEYITADDEQIALQTMAIEAVDQIERRTNKKLSAKRKAMLQALFIKYLEIELDIMAEMDDEQIDQYQPYLGDFDNIITHDQVKEYAKRKNRKATAGAG